MVRAQVISIELEYILALLKRVPVMSGLSERSGKSHTRVKRVGILSAARSGECSGHLARDIQRFLIEAKAAQVKSYCSMGR
jgi:predicted metal-binding protein